MLGTAIFVVVNGYLLVVRRLSHMLNNPLMSLTSKDRAFESPVRIEEWKKSFELSYRPMKSTFKVVLVQRNNIPCRSFAQ